ncbi:MAG: tetratricopeptide repeat protein [Proteobacteria bacterium]|nr:tetratricopeptide repeat protein [Pseudomonadota bacterium]
MEVLIPVSILVFSLFLSVYPASAGESDDVETISSVLAEGDAAMAIHMGEIFLKKYPRSDRLAEVLFLMADAEDGRGKKLELLGRIIDDFSNTDWAMKGRLERGEIFFLNGKHENAEKDFSHFRGEFVEARFRKKAVYLSAINAISSGDYEAAEGLFSLMESIDEDDGLKAQSGLADTYFLSGHCDKALIIYEKIGSSISDDSKKAKLMLKRAICLKKVGDTEEAGRLFEKIVSSYPGSLAAQSAASENAGKTREFKSPEPEGLFYLQTGVYKTSAGARDYAAGLASMGLAPLVIGGDVYKVVLGPYGDDIEAQIAGETINGEHGVESFVLRY